MNNDCVKVYDASKKLIIIINNVKSIDFMKDAYDNTWLLVSKEYSYCSVVYLEENYIVSLVTNCDIVIANYNYRGVKIL
jgi:hypothetical protein